LIVIYKEALVLEGDLRPAFRDALGRRLRSLERERDRVAEKLKAARLGARQKWDAWSDEIWNMTPADLQDAATRTKRFRRYAHPARWGYIGDRGVALAEYLTRRLPGDKQRKRGLITQNDPLPYKQRTLEIAADLVTKAYRFPYLPALQSKPLTAKDLKSGVQKRRPVGYPAQA
jgi:hypothetical protein